MSSISNRYGITPTQHQQQQQQQQQHPHPHPHPHPPVATVGPRAKCDQVIYEAICKVCEIIVGSRTGSTTTTNTSNGSSNITGTNIPTNTTNTTTVSNTSSSRFNLQIPEIASVRTILSQYRLQLHVPIRVDVYYYNDDTNSSSSVAGGTNDIHNNNNNNNNSSSKTSTSTSLNRILLERWCIEYRNVSTGIEKFIQHENIITNDPMIHLTHICKRIVVYIRTLYCIIKLLPCHTILQNMNSNNHNRNSITGSNHRIGFSIYINTDYNMNDMNELIQNHGFIYHQNQNYYRNNNNSSYHNHNNHHQNGVVITPYGELTWQVLYCPISKLESLLPHDLLRTPSNNNLRTRMATVPIVSRSQPIPMQKKSNIHNSNSNDDDDDNDNDHDTSNNQNTGNKYQTFAAPHSAPSSTWMQNVVPSTSTTTTYTERSHQQQLLYAQQQSQQQHQPHHHQNQYNSNHPVYSTTGMSYDPNRQYHQHQHQQLHHQHPPIYKKSMTTVSELHHHNHQQHQPPQQQQSSNHPLVVQRSHTTMGGIPLSTSPRMNNNTTSTSTSTTTPKLKVNTGGSDNPRRVMSGLSLALLMASNDDDDNDDPKDINTIGDNNKSTIFRVDNNSNDNNNMIGHNHHHDNNHNQDSTFNLVENDNNNNISSNNNDNDRDDDSKTQRRAALHQMPPHLLEQQQQVLTKPTSSLSMVGDYGYGYNNHIPWQKIHPSQSNPTIVTQQQQSSSPSPHTLLYHNNSFGATQVQSLSSSPSNYSTGNNINNFYSTCTSPIQPHFVTGTSYNNNNNPVTSSSTTTSPQNVFFFKSTTPTFSHLIPPRNRTDTTNTNVANNDTTTTTTTTNTVSTPTINASKSITPPFPSRPIGFIHDTPPTLLLEPSLYSNINPTSNASIRYASDVPSSNHAASSSNATTITSTKNVPPITSLDSLRSSPFQQADRHSPMLSSLSQQLHVPVIPPPISGFESDYITAVQMSLGGSNDNNTLRRSLWSTSNSSSIMPSSLAGLGGRQYQSYLFQDPHNNNDDNYLSEEMPFAIELQSPLVLDETNMTSDQHQQQQSLTKGNSTMSRTNNIGTASSTFGAASSLTTLAQKCSVPNQRLKMFDKAPPPTTTIKGTVGDVPSDHIGNSVNYNDDGDLTNSLADQLQEFRAFGASLHVSTSLSAIHSQENTTTTNTHVGFDEQSQQQVHINNILSGSGTSSTSTPISLRS
jgi:hypothetical protein